MKTRHSHLRHSQTRHSRFRPSLWIFPSGLFALALLFAASAPPSRAASIAVDDFENYNVGPLNGQTAAGSGWDGAWSVNANLIATIQVAGDSEEITYTDSAGGITRGGGKSLKFAKAANHETALARLVSGDPRKQDVFMSFIFKVDQENNDLGASPASQYHWFARDEARSLTVDTIGMINNAAKLSVRVNNETTDMAAATLVDNTVYFCVIKYGWDEAAQSFRTCQIWLNPTCNDELITGNSSVSVTRTATAGGSSDYRGIYVRTYNGTTADAHYDDIRIGATWADVVAAPTMPVPVVSTVTSPTGKNLSDGSLHPGDTLTLTGANFQSRSTVTINGVPVTSITTGGAETDFDTRNKHCTELAVTIPATIGNDFEITVTNAGGATTATQKLTITEAPALIATDDFDSYTPGASLIGQTAGGAGWADAWSKPSTASTVTVSSDPADLISYTLDNGAVLGSATSGAVLVVSSTATANATDCPQALVRNFATVPATGTDVFLSFIFKIKDLSQTDGAEVSGHNLAEWFARDAGVASTDTACSIGYNGGRFTAMVNSTRSSTVGDMLVYGRTYFAVVKYTGWDAAAGAYRTAQVWLNPRTTDENTTATTITRTYTATANGSGSMTGLRVRTYNLTEITPASSTGRYHVVDAVRVGKTWASVVGLPAPTVTDIAPTSIHRGGSITITGTNLANATVTIGGIEAVLTENTATTIVATVPDAVALGANTAVVVTTSGGNIIAAQTLTIASTLSAPSVTGVSPASIHRGGSITITGANLANATVTIGGIEAVLTENTATTIVATVPGEAALGADIAVVVTTTGGATPAAQTLTITEGPAPIAALIAEDDFDSYSAGALSGANGGAGWGAAYSAQAGATISTDAAPVTYMLPNGAVLGGGNALKITGADVTTVLSRTLATPVTDGSDVFVSFVFRIHSGRAEEPDGSEVPTSVNALTAWVAKDSADDNAVDTMGVIGANGRTTARINNSSLTASPVSTPLVFGKNMLFVVKYTGWDGASYKACKVWLNPTPDDEASSNAAVTVTKTATAGGSDAFDGIRVRTTGLNVTGGRHYLVDALRVGATWAAVVGAPTGVTAPPADLPRVVVFGDSLSSGGPGNNPSTGPNATPAYPKKTWITQLAPLAGYPDIGNHQADAVGTNYAVGGKTAVDMVGYVTDFLNDHAGAADPRHLYVLWCGANDISHAIQNNPLSFFLSGVNLCSTAGTTAAATMEAQIRRLAAAGATRFHWIDLPDLSLTPSVDSYTAQYSSYGVTKSMLQNALRAGSQAFNARMATALASLATDLPGITIHTFSAWDYFNQIVADPAAHGFANATQGASLSTEYGGAGLTAAATTEANTYLFWDGVHPTSHGHNLLANTILADWTTKSLLSTPVPPAVDAVWCAGASPAAGDLVSLAGSNLSGLSAVTIGGFAAEIVGSTDSFAKVLLPAGAAAGDPIVVTTAPPTNTSAYNGAWTPSALPLAPTVASITPATAAPGDSVTIAGANLDAVSAVSLIGADAAGAVTITAQTAASLTFTVPAGTPDTSAATIALATPAGAYLAIKTLEIKTAPADPDLIAEDNFDSYAHGADLTTDTGTGGAGWGANAWYHAANAAATISTDPADIISHTLDNGVVLGGGASLILTSTAATSVTSQDCTEALRRVFPTEYTGEDIFVSFICKVKDLALADGDTFSSGNAFAHWLARDSGYSTNDTGGVIGVAGQAGPRVNAQNNYITTRLKWGETHFYVIKYYGWDGAAYRSCQMWMDPKTTDELSANGAITKSTTQTSGGSSSFNGIRVRTYGLSIRDTENSKGRYQVIDAVRVGKTWASVVGYPAPDITDIAPTAVQPGDTITITGAHLTGATVKIGGIDAVVTPDATTPDLQLTAIVPVTIGAGAVVPVVLTTAGGTKTATQTLTVTLPAPTVTDIVPTSIHRGGSITITGANLANTTVTIGGIEAVLTENTATTIVATVPDEVAIGAGVAVVVTTSGGGNITAAQTLTIARLTQPALVITDPGAKTTTAPAFTLATTGGAGTGAVTFARTAGDDSIATVSAAGLVTPVGAGSITVTAQKAGDDDYNASAVSAPLTITIASTMPLPSVTGVSPASIHRGGSVTITGANLAGATVTIGGIGAVLTENTATTIVATVPGAVALGAGAAVSVTTGGGNITAAQTLTIVKLAQSALAITDPGAKTVADAAFQLATTGGSGSGAVTYALVSGAAATVSSDGLVTITAAGSVTIRATKAADDDYDAATAERTLTIAKLTQPALVITDPGAKTTADSAFNLATTGGSGTGAVTFTRTAGDDSIATVTAAGLVTPVGAGSITVTAQKAGDDDYNASAVSAPLTLTIAPAIPLPSITGITPTTVHPGDTIIITGANLTGATVTIGGVAATITAASDTSLTVTVPDAVALGAAAVAVTTDAGAVTASQHLTVTPAPRLIATDDFDSYAAGVALNALNGGAGWDAAGWDAKAGATITSDEPITYMLDDGTVLGGGNALKADAAGDYLFLRRLGDHITDGSDVFVSFIFKIKSTTPGDKDGMAIPTATNIFTAWQAIDSGMNNAVDTIGYIGASGAAGARVNNESATVSTVPTFDETSLFVIKYIWDSSASAYRTCQVWLNPGVNDETTTSPAITVTKTGADGGSTSFNGLRVRTLGLAAAGRYYLVDALRVGATWTDVVGDPAGAIADTSPKLVVFGDSLSSGGANGIPLTSPTPTADNGGYPRQTWAQQLSEQAGYGTLMNGYPQRAGGTNYAKDGDKTDASGLGAQVDIYLADADSVSDPESVYVLWLGTNDVSAAVNSYKSQILSDPSAFVASVTAALPDAADRMEVQIRRLIASGATRFFWVDMPNLGATPLVDYYVDYHAEGNTSARPALASAMEDASRAFNERMAARVAALREEFPAITLRTFSAWDCYAAVFANPGAFGFANVTEGSLESNDHFFRDRIHPTSHGHTVIATAALEAFEDGDLLATPVVGSIAVDRKPVAVGDIITITGESFNGLEKVLVGTVEAEVVGHTGGLIRIRFPEGATPGAAITVITATGRTTTDLPWPPVAPLDALIATDEFDSDTGGTGWAAGWALKDGTGIVSGESITYELTGVGTLGGGKALKLATTSNLNRAVARTLANKVTDGGDVFVRLIFKVKNTELGDDDELSTNIFTAWGADFNNSPSGKDTSGVIGLTGQIAARPDGTASTGQGTVSGRLRNGRTYLLVIKYTGWDGDAYRTCRVWLNPATTDENTSNSAITATGTAPALGSPGFDGLAVRTYGLAATKYHLIDALRIGSTWDAVMSNATPPPEPPSDPDNFTTVAAGPGWVRLNHSLDIAPGGVFDFAQQGLLDAPAGKHGALRVTPDGHFEFENLPGVRARFWGVNFAYDPNFPSHAQADVLAERLARSGYNTVRLHHIDRDLVNRPATFEEDLTLDETRLEKLDYLFAALKARGLYINIDLFSDRKFSDAEAAAFGVSTAAIATDNFKGLLSISANARTAWKKYATKLLNHVNPHTGLRWGDDPALIGICPVNENHPHHNIFDPEVKLLYKARFDEVYPDHANDNTNTAAYKNLYSRFIFENAIAPNDELAAHVRSLAPKALLTTANTSKVSALTFMRNRYDYVDDHLYHDHPTFPESSWAFPMNFTQASTIRNGAHVPAKMMPSRIFGKPFATTEFHFSRPNRYRAEGAVLMPAYAGLQDWDALYNFHYAKDIPSAMNSAADNYFSLANDPVSLVGDRVGAFIFRRGDIAPATTTVAYAVREDEAYQRNATNGNPGFDVDDNFRHVGLVVRIGSYPGGPDAALAAPAAALSSGSAGVHTGTTAGFAAPAATLSSGSAGVHTGTAAGFTTAATLSSGSAGVHTGTTAGFATPAATLSSGSAGVHTGTTAGVHTAATAGFAAAVIGPNPAAAGPLPAKTYVSAPDINTTLQTAGILPAGSVSGDGKTITSETGELRLDTGEGTFRAVTARGEHFVLTPGATLAGDRVTVANGAVFGAVSVVALKSAGEITAGAAAPTLAAARRILVTHLTDTLTTGMTFAAADRKQLTAWGALPHLVRAGSATLTLALPPGDWIAHKVDITGARTAAHPLTRVGGTDTWTMEISTAGAPASGTPETGAQFAYELILPPSAPVITSVAPLEVHEGDTITITGENLAGVIRVTIGGVEAAFTINSDTTLTVTVPEGAAGGAVAITVTTDGGAVTADRQLDITANPLAGFIAHDDFDRANSGSGWVTGGWTFKTGAGIVAGEPITYELAGVGTLGGGGALKIASSAANNDVPRAIARAIETPITDGRDVFVRFIFQVKNTGEGDGAQFNTGQIFTSWSADTGAYSTDNAGVIGVTGGKVAARVKGGDSTGQATVGGNLVYGQTCLFVIKYTGWDGAAYRTSQIWLNPATTDENTTAPAITATRTDPASGSARFDGLAVRAYNLNETRYHLVDALRIGSTWDAVMSETPPPLPPPPDAENFTIVEESEGWVPLDHSLDIAPGGVFDFAQQGLLDAPAGKHGALRATPAGHFEFENRPGARARFWGVNLVFDAIYLTHEQADLLAERLARSGYNTARIHHFDGYLVRDSLAAGGNSWDLDPVMLEKLDYLFHALKRRGLYINIDLFSNRAFSEAEAATFGEGVTAANAGNCFKGLVPINENALESWKKFATNLLTHTNPYTGIAWGQDPALIGICPVNEDSLFRRYAGDATENLLPRYRAKFAETHPQYAAADWDAADPARDCAWNKFIYELHAASDAAIFDHLKNTLRAKALLTGANFTSTLGLALVRRHYDYVDNHQYADHPDHTGSLPITFNQNSTLAGRANYPRGMARTRIFGKPFVTTEFHYSRPNRHRYEGTLLMPAYASLQDWDALYNFDYAKDATCVTAHGAADNYFALANDPLSLIGDRLGAFLFQRGDIAPATAAVAYAVREEEAYDGPLSKNFEGNFDAVALIARIGSVPGAPADVLAAHPALDAAVIGAPVPDPLPAKTHVSSTGLLGSLKDAGVIPAGSSNEAANHLVSDTGEIALDSAARTLRVVTPRGEHFLISAGQTLAGDRVTVANGDIAAAISVVALKSPGEIADGAPAPTLATASRILVTHLTDALTTGMTFAAPDRKTLTKWGALPHLVRNGSATLTLALPPGDWVAHKVDITGARTAAHPLARADDTGAWTMEISTGGAPATGAQFAYELVPAPIPLPVPMITSISSLETPVGGAITITGENLDGATVTIGGVPAMITANTGSTLTVVVPAGALGGDGAVVVSTGGGEATASQTLTVTPNPVPAPEINNILPLTVHPGDIITITGRNLDDAAVIIGGVPVEIISNTGDTITIRIPTGLAGGLLGIVTPGGGLYSARQMVIRPDTGDGGGLSAPAGVVATSGNASYKLYVSDNALHTIQVIATGTLTTLAGSPGVPGLADGAGAAARFNRPRGLSINRAGALIVADAGNDRLRTVTADGAVATTGATGADADLAAPAGVSSFDGASGETYIADTGNHLIKKITASGEVRIVAGAAISGTANGPLLEAQFNSPAGVAVDVSGAYLYVADTGNHAIRLIDLSGGTVSTFAGRMGIAGEADGAAATATFRSPGDLAVDGNGEVHVADTGNSRIRLIAADGARTVSTLAGGAPGFVDGAGAAARFNTPTALAFADDGSLYVADTGNHALRRLAPDDDATVTTLALKTPATTATPGQPPGDTGGGGGGGGGGAPLPWTIAALAALLIARKLARPPAP